MTEKLSERLKNEKWDGAEEHYKQDPVSYLVKSLAVPARIFRRDKGEKELRECVRIVFDQDFIDLNTAGPIIRNYFSGETPVGAIVLDEWEVIIQSRTEAE